MEDKTKFPALKYPLTEREKKTIVAKTLHTAVLAIFKTHTYSFANRFFLQRVGGPIGLRSTCCIARIVMLWWDERLIEVISKSNIKIIEGARYMDDIRIWMNMIRMGWRWSNGGLKYKKSWRLEDEERGLSPTAKAAEILEGMMNSICGWLRLTMETEEMFDGNLGCRDLGGGCQQQSLVQLL